jgi:hypothetical protein
MGATTFSQTISAQHEFSSAFWSQNDILVLPILSPSVFPRLQPLQKKFAKEGKKFDGDF